MNIRLQGNARATRGLLDAREAGDCDTLELLMAVAAKYNHADCMLALLAASEGHPAMNEGPGCRGLQPLMFAAAFGSLEVGRIPTPVSLL